MLSPVAIKNGVCSHSCCSSALTKPGMSSERENKYSIIACAVYFQFIKFFFSPYSAINLISIFFKPSIVFLT